MDIIEGMSQRDIFFVVASTILALVSPIIYAISMVRGVSKPARMTRFLSWLAPTIAVCSLYFGHSEGALFLAAIFSIRNLFLLLMSYKYGVGGWTHLDQVCLSIALVGLVGWQLFGSPLLALFASMLADTVGYIPAYIKTWKDPSSEGPLFYGIELVAIVLNMLVIGAWSMDMLYPLYILVSIIVMICIIYKQLRRSR